MFPAKAERPSSRLSSHPNAFLPSKLHHRSPQRSAAQHIWHLHCPLRSLFSSKEIVLQLYKEAQLAPYLPCVSPLHSNFRGVAVDDVCAHKHYKAPLAPMQEM